MTLHVAGVKKGFPVAGFAGREATDLEFSGFGGPAGDLVQRVIDFLLDGANRVVRNRALASPAEPTAHDSAGNDCAAP